MPRAASVAAKDRFLGLISGTSADGVDVALVEFDPQPRISAAATYPYPEALRDRILDLARNAPSVALDELGTLDVAIARHFADSANALLAHAGVDPAAITALGSHGQTVRHKPLGEFPFTMQLGDPSVIAEITGITTIADFRRGDIAAGGQGAPLAPAFHSAAMANGNRRALLNLGGIANVTVFDDDGDVLGFDTGPANCLMDAWAVRHIGQPRDEGGAWASQGTVNQALLSRLLADPYFALPAPKSTGREQFNLDWLEQRLIDGVSAIDVQATLLALSVQTIATAIRNNGPAVDEILGCGGGVHNAGLMTALADALAPIKVGSTADIGIDPDFVEAAAFAWLARERVHGRPGNLPSVTGARGPRLLGAIFAAPTV